MSLPLSFSNTTVIKGLASELLLKRYAVPPTSDPSSLLARHETGLLNELQALLAGMGSHRSATFDQVILPECMNFVLAIGHRMAYDAAVAAGVDQCLIDLYVASALKVDTAWYTENAELSRAAQREMESVAVDAVFPHLEVLLDRMDVDAYVTAPLISKESWESYLGGLPTYGDYRL